MTNGHIFDLRVAGHPFRMLPQIMMNSGRTFGASDVQGDDDYWDTPVLGRTMVKLDHNCDGALDLVIGHLDHPLVLLENQTTSPNPWLQIQLVGTKSERNAIGAVSESLLTALSSRSGSLRAMVICVVMKQ